MISGASVFLRGICVCVSVPHDSVHNSSPIFTKFGTDHQERDLAGEFVGGEIRKPTSGFKPMRRKKSHVNVQGKFSKLSEIPSLISIQSSIATPLPIIILLELFVLLFYLLFLFVYFLVSVVHRNIVQLKLQ